MIRLSLALAFLLGHVAPAAAQTRLAPEIEAAVREVMAAGARDGLEHGVCLDADNRIVGRSSGERDGLDFICDYDRTVTVVHNHPGAGVHPSGKDVFNFLRDTWPVLDRSVIVGDDGQMTVMSGMARPRPRTDEEAHAIASRYLLMVEVDRFRRAPGQVTDLFALSIVCAQESFTCWTGPLDALAGLEPMTLSGADDDAMPLMTPILRDELASWILGSPREGIDWAGLGRIAEEPPPNGRYYDVVFRNDNGNFSNGPSYMGSQVNFARENQEGYLESFEIFRGLPAEDELDICVRLGSGITGEIHRIFGDTVFFDMTSGEFEVRCWSHADPSLNAVFHQRLQDGRLVFFATADDRASGREAIAFPADTGCIYLIEELARTCENVEGANFVILPSRGEHAAE